MFSFKLLSSLGFVLACAIVILLWCTTYPYGPFSLGVVKVGDFCSCNTSIVFSPDRFFRGIVLTVGNIQAESVEMQITITQFDSGKEVFCKKVTFSKEAPMDYFLADNPSLVSWMNETRPEIRKIFTVLEYDNQEVLSCKIISWGIPVRNVIKSEKYRVSVTPTSRDSAYDFAFYAPYSVVY